MLEGKFVHLHIHSEYSLLDGANRIKELPKRAKELGMDAMAITDHGVMFGTIDFYKACLDNGVKPIIGCEVYVAPRKNTDKDPNLDDKYNHLILLAKDNEGYKNLTKLVSLGFTDGFYYKPRIDKELLEKYHEGLVCCSACLAGELSQAIIQNNIEEAKKIANWYKDLFGEDYYIEVQSNGIKEQVMVNQKLISIAKELDIGIVATNDSHYLKREDAYNHEVLMCIQTGKKMSDEDRMKYNTDELYVKSPEEMQQAFSNIPEALENTVKIAEKCNVTFEFGNTILPNYEVPKEFETHYDYMKKVCYDGINNRYGDNPSKEILDRTEYELDVINKMGYVDYFLIVWDYIAYARSKNIPVGPGRGSGAGSIVAYSMGITDIDPMKYGLLFERFLNPERISMPDFDVDFCYERRQEIIDYVEEKYGKENVSQIITFGTMSARMVIRDVARVLDVPYAEADKLAKMIPNELHITIKKAIDQNRELREIYESNSDMHNLIDIAMALEGLPRQASTHACGVVITKEPVVTYVPLYSRDGVISTQFVMTTLEEIGLLKMDFLGLRTLTVIQDTIDLVKADKGIDVKFDPDMNDPKVYHQWQDGRSIGVFQFESQGMTSFMKELKPDCLEDIIAGVSLYRPGPMDQIPRYIANKKDPDHSVYTHSSLKPILQVTYGCMVYQEQVMQIVRDLAGYSLGQADLVRRAMGKKKLDVMAKERVNFVHGKKDENGNVVIKGCIANGIDEASANKIFDEMSEFAKYAFNKSHAACYAVVAYQTAYLKTYYPAEFMAAMLNSYLGNLDRVPIYIDECKRLNVDILKPNINKSSTRFTVEKQEDGKNEAIRFGMGSIKNVGTQAVDNIVAERKRAGEYKDFTDFCERIQGETVNKKCIESLIKAGAFDEFGLTRATLMASFERIIDSINDASKKSLDGQVTMFDLGSSKEKEEMQKMKYTYITSKEFSEKELLSMEKEMLGLYISGHPLEKYANTINQMADIDTLKMKETMQELEETGTSKIKDNQQVKFAGVISRIKKKFTKNNKIMAFVTLEDMYGTCEAIVFESCYNQCSSILVEENIVLVEGRASIREEEGISILANNIKELGLKTKKVINIDITELEEEKKDALRGAIRFFMGDKNNTPVFVTEKGTRKSCGAIFADDSVIQAFREIVGEKYLELEEI